MQYMWCIETSPLMESIVAGSRSMGRHRGTYLVKFRRASATKGRSKKIIAYLLSSASEKKTPSRADCSAVAVGKRCCHGFQSQVQLVIKDISQATPSSSRPCSSRMFDQNAVPIYGSAAWKKVNNTVDSDPRRTRTHLISRLSDL